MGKYTTKDIPFFQCIVCETKIERLMPNHINLDGDPVSECYNDGVVDRFHAGYGSCLDGNKHIVAICDKCLDEKTLKGIAFYDGDYIFDDDHEYIPLNKENN